MKKTPLFLKILIAQLILYVLLFLSFNNKTYFLPIIFFLVFLFWQTEDWRRAAWLTLVAVLPFSLSWRSFSFALGLPAYFITPAGQSEIYYSIPITAEYLLVLLLFLGLVFDSNIKPKWSAKEWLLLGLMLLLATSSLFSLQPSIAFIVLLAYLIPVIIYELARIYTKEAGARSLTLQVLTTLLLFEGTWAVFQFILKHPLGSLLEREIVDSPLGIYSQETLAQFRSSGTLSHPNTLAIFLGMLLPVVMALLLSGKTTFLNRKILYLAVFTGLLGFIFTLSRWAWFSLILVLIPYLSKLRNNLIYYKNYKKWLLLAIIPLIFFLGPTVISRLTTLNEIFTENYNTLESRGDLFFEAVEMIKAKPFFGGGPGSFLPTLAENNFTGVANYFFYPVHNLYLYLTSELGILAVFILFIFIILHLRELFSGFFKDDDTSMLKKGLLMGLGFYLISALGYTGTGINFELFFILLGISAGLN